MKEADRQLLREYGTDWYLELTSWAQEEFHDDYDGGLIILDNPLLRETTVISGFENSGVISNREVREILVRGMLFLESKQGVSEIEGVQYHALRPQEHQGRAEPLGNKKWNIFVWASFKRDRDRQRFGTGFTIGHEIGHIFWEDHLSKELQRYWSWMYHDSFEEEEKMVEADKRNRVWISSNAEECFCETIGELIMRPFGFGGGRWRTMNEILPYVIGQDVLHVAGKIHQMRELELTK